MTDQPFEFEVDGVTYQAHQNGVISVKNGDTFTDLPDEQGQKIYDAFLAQDG